MQAPKNGFYFVIDRTDGAYISAKNFVPVNWAIPNLGSSDKSVIENLDKFVLTNALAEKDY